MSPICLKTGYRGKTRPSCIYVHRPDLTGRDTYDCPTCGTTWYRIPGAREVAAHPDQNWTRDASVVRERNEATSEPTLDEETLSAIEKLLGIGPIAPSTFTIPACDHGISCTFRCYGCTVAEQIRKDGCLDASSIFAAIDRDGGTVTRDTN